jgi:hypothetical protein
MAQKNQLFVMAMLWIILSIKFKIKLLQKYFQKIALPLIMIFVTSRKNK